VRSHPLVAKKDDANDDFFRHFFQTKKIHKSLVWRGFDSGKHGNLKILQVSY